MQPTVGSLFSGIGGFDLGLERAGWRVIWQVEQNPFRQKILKRHWPDVELRGDIETDTSGLPGVDLICGGFPCQDLSVAGDRAGLAGKRSGLWFEYLRMVREIRPTWVLIENVPGLLSSNKGKDFELVVSGLTKCGYGVAWRVLDSQYFGVAQRRRRVYIVGHLGAPCPLEILFEPEGSSGHPAPDRESGPKVAGIVGGGSGQRGWQDFEGSGAYIPERAHSILTKYQSRNNPTEDTLIPSISGTLGTSIGHHGYSTVLDGTGAFIPERSYPLLGGQGNDRQDESAQTYIVRDKAYALRSGRLIEDSNGNEGNVVVCPAPDADGVRTPARIPGRVDTPDGPRYAALGDAVTVPVIEWIGQRLMAAHLD